MVFTAAISMPATSTSRYTVTSALLYECITFLSSAAVRAAIHLPLMMRPDSATTTISSTHTPVMPVMPSTTAPLTSLSFTLTRSARVNSCSDNPMITAAAVPAAIDENMPTLRSDSAMMINVGSSIASPSGDDCTTVVLPLSLPANHRPASRKATMVINTAVSTTGSLLFMLSPISAVLPLSSNCCVAAAITVVSDTGAMLSPSAAPESMAPPSSAGLHPTATPAGNSVRLMALMVPKPEPVDIAKSPEKRNTASVNNVPLTLSAPAAHTSPSAMCPAFSMLPYTPTRSHSITAVMAVLPPAYSKMVCQYSSLSPASTPPIMIAVMPTAVSRLMSVALKKDRVMALTTKSAKGRAASHLLPP